MFLQRLDPNKTQFNKVQAQTIIIKSVITTFNYNFINTFRYTLFKRAMAAVRYFTEWNITRVSYFQDQIQFSTYLLCNPCPARAWILLNWLLFWVKLVKEHKSQFSLKILPHKEKTISSSRISFQVLIKQPTPKIQIWFFTNFFDQSICVKSGFVFLN